jgi:TolB-like protein/Tfp pilus assembly protein PilF
MDRPFPAYKGDEPHVFVCYSHADADDVYPEIEWLHDQAINVWYDEGISAGKNWRAETGLSLERADRVLFYISRHSLESDHCNREINLALDEGKEIIPVYLEDVTLTPDLKIGLNRVHALHRESGAGDTYRSTLLAALLGADSVAALDAASKQQADNSDPYSRKDTKRKSLWIALAIAATIVIVTASTLLLVNSSSVDNPVIAGPNPYVLVVPFDVSTADGVTWNPFADQVTREIIRNLRKVSGLRVVPAPSAFTFNTNKTRPHIRSQVPEVRYVLDGLVSVESHGNIRITLALEDLQDESRIIWDDAHFIRANNNDLFGVQTDIARSVSASLKVAILDSEERALTELPTNDLDAYAMYMEGLAHQAIGTNEGFIKSIERFDAAIQRDMNFTLAHVAKAKSYRQRMTFFEPPRDMLSHVRTAATEAITIDPDSAEARSALGMAYLQSWRWLDAWLYLSDAKSRDPRIGVTHLGLALYYTGLGDARRAFDALAEADRQDPLNPEITFWGLFIFAMFETYTEGIKWADKKLPLFPNTPLVASNAALLYSLAGDHEKAVLLSEESVRLGQRGPFFLIFLAQAYIHAGRVDDAREMLAEAEQSETYVCPYETAAIHIALDDFDQAFELLDRAVGFRSNCLMFTRQDPRLKAIRDDPRFTTLINITGLDETSVREYPR